MTTNRTPAEKAEARKNFLKELVPFVLKVTRERGTVVQRNVDFRTKRTNVVRELTKFVGFTFQTDTDQTEVGGNNMKIIHHGTGEPLLVFEYNYTSTPHDGQIKTFLEDKLWQDAIKRLMKSLDKRIAEDDERKERLQKRHETEKKRALEREKLLKMDQKKID